ncbi:MAG TPA: RNA methyltransferase [Chryseolinea sp.]|nr:RNA methyltransferase [Chryseolinea sp.]HPM29647.1 RNA methyltransferase [Chryseolinea sp.]
MTHLEKLTLEHLSRFVSDHKKEFAAKVLNVRTRQVTVVLENIYQSQNSSAVIRTCECMGLQDVHVIEDKSKYFVNRRVLKGAHKWTNIVHHLPKVGDATVDCFNRLKKDGYKILVADPAEEGISIHDVPVDEGKLALVFGNELHGVSETARLHADQKIRIPMFGFTESLNISASVAICLSSLITRLHASENDYGLSAEEKESIQLEWYRKIVKRSDLIEREFIRTIR